MEWTAQGIDIQRERVDFGPIFGGPVFLPSSHILFFKSFFPDIPNPLDHPIFINIIIKKKKEYSNLQHKKVVQWVVDHHWTSGPLLQYTFSD